MTGRGKCASDDSLAAHGEVIERARVTWLHGRVGSRVPKRILVSRAIKTVHSVGGAVRHSTHLLAAQAAAVTVLLHALLVQLAAALLALEHGLDATALVVAASDGASVAG